MIAFICLFLPAVLGVAIYEHLKKAKLCRRQWLYRYCFNAVFINMICFAVKRFLLGTGGDAFTGISGDATPATAVNYLIMAIPTSAVLAFLQVLWGKHAKVTHEENADEENA